MPKVAEDNKIVESHLSGQPNTTAKKRRADKEIVRKFTSPLYAIALPARIMFDMGLFSLTKTGKLPNAPPRKLPKKAALATCKVRTKYQTKRAHNYTHTKRTPKVGWPLDCVSDIYICLFARAYCVLIM